MMVTVVGGDGAGDDDCIPMVMPMATAMVIERYPPVVSVMQALAFLVDDPDVVVVPMVGPDDDVSLGCRSQSGQSHRKRQSAHDHCFHCKFSNCFD
ncbi:hypothetical protein X741_11470 [Mesorhizobium sp. LNHC229A00]|nr:hypothetical protein X741_11470 [Mesorhizobium sp. LNHC229A00]